MSDSPAETIPEDVRELAERFEQPYPNETNADHIAAAIMADRATRSLPAETVTDERTILLKQLREIEGRADQGSLPSRPTAIVAGRAADFITRSLPAGEVVEEAAQIAERPIIEPATMPFGGEGVVEAPRSPRHAFAIRALVRP